MHPDHAPVIRSHPPAGGPMTRRAKSASKAGTTAAPALATVAPRPGLVVHPLARPPFVAGAYATRKATATVESAVGVAESIWTSVTATVTTDTERADATCIAVALTVARLHGRDVTVSID